MTRATNRLATPLRRRIQPKMVLMAIPGYLLWFIAGYPEFFLLGIFLERPVLADITCSDNSIVATQRDCAAKFPPGSVPRL